MTGRPRTVSALAVGLVAGSVVGAVAANGGTAPDPPPRIAFVARGDVPADALVVGPIAGRLGAPLFTTPPDQLAAAAERGLVAYGPELVIIAGGTSAITAATEAAIETALGLGPDEVFRVAGDDRYETAEQVAALIEHFDPAFLPVEATAANAERLDGLGSDAFLRSGEPLDADTLDGLHAEQLGRLAVAVDPDTSITTFGASTWVDVPDATTTVSVPAGHTGHIVARFTGVAYCATFDVSDTDGVCYMRVLVDGADTSVDTNGVVVGTSWDYIGLRSIERVAGPLGPGNHSVTVQVRAQASTDVQIGFDDWTLVAEVKLAS